MQENNVVFPHPRQYKTRADMQNSIGHDGVKFDGMVPFLHPSEQMNILKAREKKLLLNRWRETW
ncbi:hypothetical protein HDU99_005990, partial [Rhizoclosmatium hyalinum]